jgi:type IV pilus assembly PilX-like protein
MSGPVLRRAADQKGVALISVLLLLMLVSALCAALTMGATTETLIARNHQSAGEARAAAEAGLNHGVQITIANLLNWQANGFASRSAAMTGMLRGPDKLTGTAATNADNGSLEAVGIIVADRIPRPPARLTLGTGSYEVRLFDDDDPANGITLSAADQTRILEDGQPYGDANTVIVVRATGYGPGKTVAVIEAAISRLILPAIVANQDLLISGSPAVSGIRGGVHSNKNLTLTGSPDIAQDATAAGTYTSTGNPTIGGVSGGDFGMLTIPPIRAVDYQAKSTFTLQADGKIIEVGTKGGGSKTVCNANANPNACKASGYAWTYSSGTWSLGDTTVPPAGTYYVMGNVDIGGSPGSSSAPAVLSIIATGNIDISGSPYFRPFDPDVLFVTDMDLRIGGNFTVPFTLEGQMLVHEQVALTGNPTLAGLLLVEGAASVSNLVTANVISGNPTLISNGITSFGGFEVSAWRQVR